MNDKFQSPTEIFLGIRAEMQLVQEKISEIESTVLRLIDMSEDALDIRSCENLQSIDLVFQATAALVDYVETLASLEWLEQHLNITKATSNLPLFDMKCRLQKLSGANQKQSAEDSILF